MVDEARDMLCRARTALLLLYCFSDRDLAQARSARPDLRCQALPHGVFHPMQCGPCLSSGAGTLQGTDAGDGGLFISKSPVVLLDQPPQCAAVERPRYRRDLSLACLLGNMTLSDLNPVDEFHCMEFVPGFFIQWIICLLFQSIGAGFGEYLRIKSSGFSPYQAWRALRRLARDGNHRVAASPGRRA